MNDKISPKEEAAKLVDKYSQKIVDISNKNGVVSGSLTTCSAIKLAIWEVDAVISYAKSFGDMADLDIKHLEEVKEELEFKPK